MGVPDAGVLMAKVKEVNEIAELQKKIKTYSHLIVLMTGFILGFVLGALML
jgi:hypothetical protein